MDILRLQMACILAVILPLFLSSCYQEQYSATEKVTGDDGMETGTVIEDRENGEWEKEQDPVSPSEERETEAPSPPSDEGEAGAPSPPAQGADDTGKYPESVEAGHFHPGYYMSVGEKDSLLAFNVISDNPDFVGVKKRYAWVDIEPQKGQYNFSEIVADLEYLQSIGKYLWVEILKTTFSPDGLPKVPSYMWKDSKYGCGHQGKFYGSFKRTVQKGGWLPCQGDSDFDERVTALFAALGERFNSEPYFEGLNLGETSTGKRPDNLSVAAELQSFKKHALAAKKAFPDKTVMQMINYARFDLEEFAEWLAARGIATGGPDVHVASADKGTLGMVYAIHKKNHWRTPNGIDVQWDNWDNRGKQYSSLELIETAVEYINPWYLFWDKKPGVFREDVVPAVREYGPLPAAEQFYSSKQ